jgi:hypothetical protein
MPLKNLVGIVTLILIGSCTNVSQNSSTDKSLKPEHLKTATSKSMTQKKFSEAANTAVFTTKFVVIDNKDITEVYHEEEDGAWQFFSDDRFDDYRTVVKVVGLGQILKRDSTLFEIADMPVGHFAHRKFKGDKWIVEKKK